MSLSADFHLDDENGFDVQAGPDDDDTFYAWMEIKMSSGTDRQEVTIYGSPADLLLIADEINARLGHLR
jgi:hypothetical protein